MNFLFKILFIFIVLLSINDDAIAQKWNTAYINYVSGRDSLYDSEKFDVLIQLYEKVVSNNRVVKKFRINDYYFAACSYSLLDDNENSFSTINKMLTNFKSYSDEWLLEDSDFDNLKADKRWEQIEKLIKTNIKKDKILKEDYIDVINQLNTIRDADLADRDLLNTIQNYKSNTTKSEEEKRQTIKEIKDRDIQRVKATAKILDKYSWLPKSIIGEKAASALFLSVQHSEKKYLKKYIKLFKKTVKTGKASWSMYATMLDRLRLMQNKKQIFATQSVSENGGLNFKFFKIKNKRKLHFLRAWYDLPSLKQQMIHIGMEKFEETSKKWNEF